MYISNTELTVTNSQFNLPEHTKATEVSPWGDVFNGAMSRVADLALTGQARSRIDLQKKKKPQGTGRCGIELLGLGSE